MRKNIFFSIPYFAEGRVCSLQLSMPATLAISCAHQLHFHDPHTSVSLNNISGWVPTFSGLRSFGKLRTLETPFSASTRSVNILHAPKSRKSRHLRGGLLPNSPITLPKMVLVGPHFQLLARPLLCAQSNTHTVTASLMVIIDWRSLMFVVKQSLECA